MPLTKRILCQKMVEPFIIINIFLIGVMFILFLVVSLFNQSPISFVEVVILSVMSVFPLNLVLGPIAIISTIKGLNYIKEQEEFYQIIFDDSVKNISMKGYVYEGLDWYIDIDRLRFIVFKNGYITGFKKYKKIGNSGGGRVRVTAVCINGKKIRLKGTASSIAKMGWKM